MAASAICVLLLAARGAAGNSPPTPQNLPAEGTSALLACAPGDATCSADGGAFSLLQFKASSGPAWPFPNKKPTEGTPPALVDVMAAFSAINGDAGKGVAAAPGIGFPDGYSKGFMPYTEHFQGIQRMDNFVYISGSGQTAGEAQLFVLQMASRKKAGAMTDSDFMDAAEADKLVKVVEFDKEFWHAGGFSIYGKYLAVGAEHGCSFNERVLNQCKVGSRVHFFDLTNPADPKKLPYVVERETATAGAVALTREADGRFLLMVGGVDSNTLDFYRSSGTSLAASPGFSLFASWSKQALQVSPGVHTSYASYQNMNFLTQKDGKLFLLGTTRTSKGLGSDVADLFEVDNSHPKSVSLKKVAEKHLKCQPGTCNMCAGGGAYVNSPTELYIYATDWEPIPERFILINEFHGSA